MKFRTGYRILLCGAAAVLSVIFAGCSFSGQKDIVEGFSVEKYEERFAGDRISISGYGDQYKQEAEKVLGTEYENFNYEGCEFLDLPETEELEVLAGMEHGITVQESWDTIENWLESIGKLDEIDMKSEVRVATEQLGTDENDEWYLFYEHMSELDSGKGAFINSNQCHIQIVADGIYSMSDGKITQYLNRTSSAAGDAFGPDEEDLVERGTFAEMKDKTYRLIDGDLSVEEGAELVKAYFLAGTPFPLEEGVSIDIPMVSVYKLGDVYEYDYTLRRIYNGVPFIYYTGVHINYETGNYYSMRSDSKHAYVADESGVTAFCGNNESEKLVSLVKGEDIIGIECMAEILSQGFGSSMDIRIDTVDMVYVPLSFDYLEDPEAKIIFPCWQFAGRNMTKGEDIRIYADVFTGDIYYHTYREEE